MKPSSPDLIGVPSSSFHSRRPTVGPLALLFVSAVAALSVPYGNAVRAGIILGPEILGNGTNFNQIDLSGNNAQHVGPPGNSFIGPPPGAYSLSDSGLYTDQPITNVYTLVGNIAAQLVGPQLVQSGQNSLTASAARGWFNKSDTEVDVTGSFTLTTPYYYKLSEQVTASGSGPDTFAAGQLNGPSGLVTSWFLSAGTTPTSVNQTESGLLEPGSYSLHFGLFLAVYSNGDVDNVTAGSSFGGQSLSLQSAVPEPASLSLMGIGVACVAGYGWRRRRPPRPA